MIYEGQIMINEKNISDFDKYLVSSQEILKAITDCNNHKL